MDPVLQRLIDSGTVTPAQVNECTRQLAKMAAQGVRPLPTVRELLERRGFLASSEPATQRAPSTHPTAAMPAVPGEKVGRFLRQRLLGRGGMGAVYLGYDPELKREVALKFLTVADSEEDVARFLREAQTAAKLRHPNIAPVYDVGREEQQHFIAMEYVDGTTIDKAKLPLRKILELMVDVAAAVDYANTEGVVHRDLKPSNLMVDKRGRVFVMDFGLARSTAADSRLSVSGTLVGTPSFMPPEQAEGRKDIDARADVYALGATLYALATGKPPFLGDGPIDTAIAVIETEVVPPRKLNPKLAADVETIILKAMEKDRARRYASAREFGDDVRRFLDAEPILARPASPIYRMWKRVAKHRGVALTAAAALLIVAGVGLTFALQTARKNEEDALAKEIWEAEKRTEGPISWAEELAPQSLRLAAERRPELEQILADPVLARVAPAYRAWFDALCGKKDAFSGIAAPEPVTAVCRARWRLNQVMGRMPLPQASIAGHIEADGVVLLDPPLLAEALGELRRVAGSPLWKMVREGQGIGELCRALELARDGRRAEAAAVLEGLAGDLICGRAAGRLAGMIHFEAKDPAGAARAWTAAARQRPSCVLLWQLASMAEFLAAISSEDPAPGLRRALDAASRSVESGPPRAEAFMMRGVVLRQLGRQKTAAGQDPRGELRQAIDDYDFASKLRPDVAIIYANAANVLSDYADTEPSRAIEMHERAVKALDRALELDPKDTVALINRGDAKRQLASALKERGRDVATLLAEAKSDCTAAIERGGHELAFAGRAGICLLLGDPDGAITDATKALTKNPRLVMALMYRAAGTIDLIRLNGTRGADPSEEVGKAFTDFDAVLAIEPRYAKALNNRAALFMELGTMAASRNSDPTEYYRKALDDAQRAVTINPRYLHALLTRASARAGVALWQMHAGRDAQAEIDLARQDFDAAVGLAPNSTLALSGRGTFLISVGREVLDTGDPSGWVQRGIDDLSEVLRIEPGHRASLLNRATAYLTLGQAAISQGRSGADHLRRAIADFDGLIADPVARINRAYALRKLAEEEKANRQDGRPRLKAAIEDLEAVVAAHPTNASALEMRAETYVELAEAELALRADPKESFRRAETACNEFLRAFPTSGRAWRRRAEFHRSVAEALKTTRQDPREWYQRGIDDYSKALELSSQDVVALTNRAHLYGAMAQAENALQRDAKPWLEKSASDYRACVKLAPKYWIVYANLASTLDELGDRPGAIEVLKEGLKNLPGHPKLAERLEALRK